MKEKAAKQQSPAPPATFSTPQHSRRGAVATSTPATTPGTPDSMTISDVSSLGSFPMSLSETSLTLDIGSLKVGGKRGRPRKQLIPPSLDDAPVNASKEEMNQWKAAKKTAQWRYEKKTGPSGAEYRRAENKRSSTYYYQKKEETRNKVESEEDIVDITEDNREAKKKAQSCAR